MPRYSSGRAAVISKYSIAAGNPLLLLSMVLPFVGFCGKMQSRDTHRDVPKGVNPSTATKVLKAFGQLSTAVLQQKMASRWRWSTKICTCLCATPSKLSCNPDSKAPAVAAVEASIAADCWLWLLLPLAPAAAVEAVPAKALGRFEPALAHARTAAVASQARRAYISRSNSLRRSGNQAM
jgi:hypothetical protein